MIRYRVVAFAVALAAITYLDRVCISIPAPSIQKDLGLSKQEMSYIFSAFTIAYTVFEIPTAWWADRSGTRSVLARIVASWSCFTIATSAAVNFWSMWVIRFLFGAGEAGAWPCVARTFERWIPAKERGKIQGIFFAGAHAAGGQLGSDSCRIPRQLGVAASARAQLIDHCQLIPAIAGSKRGDSAAEHVRCPQARAAVALGVRGRGDHVAQIVAG